MMMGHGDEATTYEHYVHSLDLLLFFSCCSGRFDPVKVGPYEHRYPRRSETAQLLAVLGYQSTSRVDTSDRAALLKQISDRRPEIFSILDSAISPGAATSDAGAITLQDLLMIEVAKSWRGWPEHQAQRDTVNALLPRINAARLEDVDRLKRCFYSWVKAQLKDDDWASMDGKGALDFYAVSPALVVEVLWVRSKGRKTLKTKIEDALGLSRACDAGVGKIWVRLRDPRIKKPTSRKKKSTQARSKTQSTISWVLHATLLLLTESGAKAKGDSAPPASDTCAF